jgi:trimethylamine-N-oxide reductase cytochrome c-type subunit TorC
MGPSLNCPMSMVAATTSRLLVLAVAISSWPAAAQTDGASRLETAARQTPDSAKAAFAITTVSLYLVADTKADSQGSLMPSAPVDVLGREGDFFKVKISGWQQEGVDRIAYYAPGKRIPSALFRPDAIGKLKKGEVSKDADTGQAWTRVEIEAYVPRDKFVADLAPIWSYAAELVSANCASCHPIDLGHFTANQWTGVIKSMQPRTSMSPEELRLLTQYAQKHASDVVATKH